MVYDIHKEGREGGSCMASYCAMAMVSCSCNNHIYIIYIIYIAIVYVYIVWAMQVGGGNTRMLDSCKKAFEFWNERPSCKGQKSQTANR